MTVASCLITIHVCKQFGSVLSVNCHGVVEGSKASLPLAFSSLIFLLCERSVYQNSIIHFVEQLGRNKKVLVFVLKLQQERMEQKDKLSRETLFKKSRQLRKGLQRNVR